MKLELEELIAGNSISKVIDDSIVMSEVEDSNENIGCFLLMSGYLKAVKLAIMFKGKEIKITQGNA